MLHRAGTFHGQEAVLKGMAPGLVAPTQRVAKRPLTTQGDEWEPPSFGRSFLLSLFFIFLDDAERLLFDNTRLIYDKEQGVG